VGAIVVAGGAVCAKSELHVNNKIAMRVARFFIEDSPRVDLRGLAYPISRDVLRGLVSIEIRI
jgi:hypothetical protein